MKRRILPIVALLGLVVGIGVLWRGLDPTAREIRRIQKTLHNLAENISFTENDPPFRRLAYPARVVSFFAPTTDIVDISVGSRAFSDSLTRKQLEESATAWRATQRGLSVQFIDIAVELGASRNLATAHLTSKIFIVGESDYYVQEFRLALVKEEGDWRVQRVATVRTMQQ